MIHLTFISPPTTNLQTHSNILHKNRNAVTYTQTSIQHIQEQIHANTQEQVCTRIHKNKHIHTRTGTHSHTYTRIETHSHNTEITNNES